MHPNAEVIRRLYTALQRLDGDAMAACYHPEATFSDPVFAELHGAQVGMMWKMLCRRARDFTAEFGQVTATDDGGSADVVARYRYTKTNRMVQNVIHAEFEFLDGFILRQRDEFDLKRWMRMALGPMGTLIHALPPLRARVRKTAAEALAKFSASEVGRK